MNQVIARTFPFVGLVALAFAACPLGIGVAWMLTTGAEAYWHAWMSVFGASGLSLTAWAASIGIPLVWATTFRD